MEKIKQFIESDKGKDILTVLIVILVGIGSFELGRLSKNDSSGIKIEYTGQKEGQTVDQAANAVGAANTAFAANSSGKTFFASSRGKKYYSIGCSAGKTIKQENRIYFSTKEEAERAGYELSSSCR